MEWSEFGSLMALVTALITGKRHNPMDFTPFAKRDKSQAGAVESGGSAMTVPVGLLRAEQLQAIFGGIGKVVTE